MTKGVIRTHLSRSVCTLSNSHPPQPPLCYRGFPGGTDSKICLQCRRPWINPLGWEDPLETEMATHSSIPAWRIPQTGVWRATVYRVAKSQTTTERISTPKSLMSFYISEILLENFPQDFQNLSFKKAERKAGLPRDQQSLPGGGWAGGNGG